MLRRLLITSAIGALAVSSAQAAQGPWALPPVNLTTPDLFAETPQVAVAPDGTAAAIWRRAAPGGSRIQASLRSPGGAFQAPVDVSSIFSDVRNPQVDVGPDGTVIAVWLQVTAPISVRVAVRPPGGSFGAASSLSPPGANAGRPQVDFAGDGTATVAWFESDGPDNRIRTATRPPGGTFSVGPYLSNGGSNATDPSLGVGPDGTAVIAWSQDATAYASIRPAGGAFGPATPLSAAGNSVSSVRAAIAPDGTAVAAWAWRAAPNPAPFAAQVAVRPPGGGFGPATDVSLPGGSASETDITIGRDGTATVLFTQFDGAVDRATVATRPPGGAFGTPQIISAAGGGAFDPRIRTADDGTTTAIFVRDSGTNGILQAATRPSGGGFAPAVDLSASGFDAESPAIGLMPDGAAIAVWRQSTAQDPIIQAAFTANAPSALVSPTATGNGTLGQILTCAGASFTNAASTSVSWLRDGVVVGSGATYLVTPLDQGRTIVCRVTGTNGFGQTSSDSAGVAIPVTVRCDGLPATIVGTPGNDVITGTPGPDVIASLGGNDRVSGLAGNDRICLGSGNDRGIGGSGNDRIFGERGRDILLGQRGNDRLVGGIGNDVIVGHQGRDLLLGGSGRDTLRGGTGNDRLDGGSANDRLFGDSGRDRLLGRTGNDRLVGGSGNDILLGHQGRDILIAGSGRDLARGGSGNDRIVGGAHNDRLYGDRGRDTISGGTGNDRIFGNAHNDRLFGNSGRDRLIGGSGFDRAHGGAGADGCSAEVQISC